jgi:zinc protease
VHVGSNREVPGKTGFAHFFEHMSFNHSENTPVGANRKLIPEWSGERNGWTNQDATVFHEVVPKDAFEKILWIDSDRLGYMIKTVTADALAREIQVVKNEKRQNYDNVPYGHTREVIHRLLYPENHPYHWLTIGSLADLEAASLVDVKEFYGKFYGPNNAVLSIVGDIDIEHTKKRVQAWFGEIKKGPEVKPLRPLPVKLDQTKIVYVEDNFAAAPEMQIVFPAVHDLHPDAYPLTILGTLLAGNKSSPLYQVVVEEKKLAPRISAYLEASELAGKFVLTVRALPHTPLNTVKEAITEGLNRFEQKPFSLDELKRVKALIEIEMAQSFTNVLDRAVLLAENQTFTDNPAYIATRAKNFEGVLKEDIERVYRQYIKDKPFIMTNFVPKGESSLVVDGAQKIAVHEEVVTSASAHESVSQGKAAHFEKTLTIQERTEPPLLEMPMFRMPPL